MNNLIPKRQLAFKKTPIICIEQKKDIFKNEHLQPGYVYFLNLKHLVNQGDIRGRPKISITDDL